VASPPIESWSPTSHAVTVDGVTTLELFGEPEFKRTSEGWTAVDEAITEGTGTYPFEALGLVNPVHFGSTAATLMTIDTLDGPVTFGLAEASGAAPVLDKGVLTYPQVFPGVDLQLSTAGGQIAKQLILADSSVRQSFEFTISTDDHSLGDPVKGQNESWSFPAATAFGTGIELPSPAAWSQGTDTVTVLPGTAHQEVRTTASGYAVDLSLDPLWAEDADFPVVLDPAVGWTDDLWYADAGLAVAFAPEGETTCDGQPCELAEPMLGMYGGRTLVGDLSDDEPDLGHYVTYVGADVAALADRQVSRSILHGYDYAQEISVHDVCAPVGPGSSGADVDDARCGQKKLRPELPRGEWAPGNYNFDVTDSLRKAVRGESTTGHVAGFALGQESQPGWDRGRDLDTPMLQIIYAGYPVPRPLSEGQTFGCACWAGSSTSNQALAGDPVNTATGALVETFGDLTLPSVGQSIELTRTYNSLDTTEGPLGPGWSFAYGATLLEDEAGVITFRDGSGTQTRFSAVLGGGYAPLDPAVSAELTDGPDGTRVLRNLSGATMTFGPAGELAATADERGQGITLTYADGRLATVSDSLGQNIQLAWDTAPGADRITTATSSDGRTVTYDHATVAGALRLVAVTAVDGSTTTFGYDEVTGGLSNITDPMGHVRARNTYDPATKRIVSQLDQSGAQMTFDWDPATQTATITDATGRTRQDVYSGLNLVRQIDGEGAVSETFYDGDNNAAAQVDAADVLYETEYDERDRLVRRTKPAPFYTTERWTYDDADRVTSYTDPEGATTTYTYDELGNLISTTAADGGVTTYTYTTAGDVPANLLATVTDPLGRVTSYQYDGAGNRVSQTTPGGRTTTFTYDAAHRLTGTTDPLGSTTSTVYDAAGRVLTTTDALGAVTTHEYDAAGRRTRTIDPLGAWTEFTYDPVGRLTQTTTSAGRTTSSAYDDAGRLASATDARGKTTSYTYDSVGRLLTSTDPLGHTTTRTLDDLGRLTTLTDPTGAETTHEYDTLGRVAATTDADGVTTRFAYDRRDNLIATTDSTGASTTQSYDVMGRPTWTFDGDGTWTRNEYDAAGQLTAVFTPSSDGDRYEERTSYIYDADGLRTAVIEPRGNVPGAVPADYTTTYAYDAAGNQTASTDPLGNTTAITYDAAGRPTVTTDPAGGAITTQYDALGRVTQVLSATGNPTSYTYDDTGNLLSTTDPLGRTTTHTYDGAGNVLTTTDPLNRVTAMAYDDAGRLSETVKPSGTRTSEADDGTIRYQYDEAGRVTRLSFSDGSPPREYTYSAAGRLLNATRADDGIAAAEIELVYDDAGRVTGVTRTGPTSSTATYAYTPGGKVAAVDYSNGIGAAYAYDAAGRLNSLTPTGTEVLEPVTYAFDPAGRLATTTRGTTNATTSTYAYDAAGRLSGLTHTAGNATLATYAVTRDSRGNPVHVTGPSKPVATPDEWITTSDTATDDFDRDIDAGWDSSSEGAEWSVSVPERASVSDGVAKHTLTTGTDVTSTLADVTATDTDLRATFRMDEVPSGDDVYTELIARQVGDARYGVEIGLWSSDGSMMVNVFRADSQWWTTLGSLPVENTRYAPGTQVDVRLKVSGTSPTTIQAKVWVGAEEPDDWQFTGSDDSPELQEAGAVAIASNLVEWEEDSEETATILFDDVAVTTSSTTLVPGIVRTEHAEYTYDSNGWLTGYCTHEGTGCQEQVSYEYDAVGNRTVQNEATGTTSYSYDDANQLLSAQHGDTTTLTNTWSLDGAITTSVTPAGTRTQTTNLAGEVTGYVLPDGRDVSYSYDPEGNRTARLVDDAIDATWTWDSITGLPTRTAQHDAQGNPSTQWLPDPLAGSGTAIAAVHGTSEHTWLLTDPFGNIRDTTTAGASLTAADPFGAPPTGGDSTVAGLGFAGQYLDQVTGLYDLRARDYDPITGRFTATDPVTAPVGMPALTGFAYAANTPLVLSDPTGEWPDWLDDTGTAAKGVGLGVLDTVSWIGRFLWIGTNADANAELQASLREANEQGGAWLVVNQFNPVYSLLENTTTGWELAQQGCVEESARAFTHSTFDVAGTVGLAAGGASMARSLTPVADASVSSVTGVRAVVDAGKFDYLFGKVDSTAHNAARSAQNAQQFARIGVYDNAVGRSLLLRHFDDVVASSDNIVQTMTNEHGTLQIRESLFAGPGGFLKLESAWEVTDAGLRLTTVIPKGGS
jgi:RHS repeat-associated protein